MGEKRWEILEYLVVVTMGESILKFRVCSDVFRKYSKYLKKMLFLFQPPEFCLLATRFEKRVSSRDLL